MEESSHGSGAPPAAVQPGFSMAGGAGEESYSRNSQVQKGVSASLQPSLQDTLLRHFSPPPGAGPIHYADFGCAVGANTIDYAKFVYGILSRRPELRRRDFVYHFADLPSNDFNTLFNQLPPIAVRGGHGDGSSSEEQRTWFASGVPGSQFDRMFPRASLHVTISTLSLQFLPEIPNSVLDKTSPAYNKGHTSCHGASPAAAEAFAETSRNGLRKFFECRAEELPPGGVLALLCTARRDRAHPEVQLPDCTLNFIPVLVKAWKELINEGCTNDPEIAARVQVQGVVAEEVLDSFNMPQCSPSVGEIQEAIELPTSAFHIQKLEAIDAFRPFPDDAENSIFKDAQSFANLFTNASKSSGTGSRLNAHLGHELTEILLERMRQNLEKDYSKWKDIHFSITLRMCMAILIRM